MDLMGLIGEGRTLLLDGAMGTELSKRGQTAGGQSNLECPDVVERIHCAYADCGCHALTTNTLTMNRIHIESHGVGVDVRAVNRTGVDLARRIAGNNLCVLGNLSSTGQLLEPYGTYAASQFQETFKEQAGILAEAGVDAFLIETMLDLREAVCALRACKEITDLPVIVSMAFSTEDKGGRTIMGNSAHDCAVTLVAEGADVIGANCGDLDPTQVAKIVTMLRSETSLPLIAQPNAGRPKLVGEETVFDMTPEAFAEGLRACVDAGAQLVGGCCGTSPEHIRVAAQNLQVGRS